MKVKNLLGKRYGRLLIIKRAKNNKDGKAKWVCICDCGRQKEILGDSLVQGKTISCGCFRKETATIQGKKGKHHLSRTRIYKIWLGMKSRCYKKTNIAFENYKKKNIKVCTEWLDVEKGFENFYNWAIKNGYQENLTLDRINNDGDYEPSNCRWATYKQQENNRSNNHIVIYKNKKYTLSELAAYLNIPSPTLAWRIKHNWNEDELSMSVNLNNKNIRRKK